MRQEISKKEETDNMAGSYSARTTTIGTERTVIHQVSNQSIEKQPKTKWYDFRKIQIPSKGQIDFKSLTLSGRSTKYKTSLNVFSQFSMEAETPSTAVDVFDVTNTDVLEDEENVTIDEHILIKGCPSLKVMPTLNQKNFTPRALKR